MDTVGLLMELRGLLREGRALPLGTVRYWGRRKVAMVKGRGGWEMVPKVPTVRSREAALDPREELAGAIARGDLKGSVEEHEKLAGEVVEGHRKGFDAAKERLRGVVGGGFRIDGRVKEVESILGKLARKPRYGGARGLQDVTGMRVVADSIKEVKDVVKKIKASYEVVTEDDYIDKPKGDYRSYHVIVRDGDGLEKEIQVRTRNQDKFAMWAHHLYKPENVDQAVALKKSSGVISKYASAASSYLYRQDLGIPPGSMPDCPPVVRKVFSCL